MKEKRGGKKSRGGGDKRGEVEEGKSEREGNKYKFDQHDNKKTNTEAIYLILQINENILPFKFPKKFYEFKISQEDSVC